MIRRRYRIEASSRTLKRLVDQLAEHAPTDAFIERVSCNVDQEYYFVVVVAPEAIHLRLKANRFIDSITLKPS